LLASFFPIFFFGILSTKKGIAGMKRSTLIIIAAAVLAVAFLAAFPSIRDAYREWRNAREWITPVK